MADAHPDDLSSAEVVDPHPAAAPHGPAVPVPPGFSADTLEVTFASAHPRQAVWDWLCDPATFTDSQVPPWRVEFVDRVTGDPGGFEPGVLTNHHGPGLDLPAVIGEVRAPSYRDLRYLYGAHVLSPRLARPTRLQFRLDDLPGGGTSVRLQVDAQVRRGLVRPWRAGNRWFWARFGRWLERAVARRTPG